MRTPHCPRFTAFSDPDWDFFLPDDETHPEPGDFWIEPEDDE